VLGSGAGGQKINKTSPRSACVTGRADSRSKSRPAVRARSTAGWRGGTLAERLLARIAGVASARQQESERIRRQKRRRSRRQRARMLADKRHHAATKAGPQPAGLPIRMNGGGPPAVGGTPKKTDTSHLRSAAFGLILPLFF